jgi:hypothetical protein
VISLHRVQFPNSKADLLQALEESLGRVIQKTESFVTISARVFPYLDEIALNFDGAQFDAHLPALPQPVGPTKQACEAAHVQMNGRRVSIGGTPLNLELSASDVIFHQGRDDKGEALLIVQSVRTGHFVLSIAKAELEKAVRKLAEREASGQGITVEETQLSLRARGPRSVAVEVRLRARKLLFRTNIDISGHVEIDDHFQARVSGIKCRGEGTIGSLACKGIQPHLQRLEGRSFPLTSLPFGDIKLRDVRITVADAVEVAADFGSAG